MPARLPVHSRACSVVRQSLDELDPIREKRVPVQREPGILWYVVVEAWAAIRALSFPTEHIW